MKNMRNEMNAEALEMVNGGMPVFPENLNKEDYLRKRQHNDDKPYGGAEGNF